MQSAFSREALGQNRERGQPLPLGIDLGRLRAEGAHGHVLDLRGPKPEMPAYPWPRRAVVWFAQAGVQAEKGVPRERGGNGARGKKPQEGSISLRILELGQTLGTLLNPE